MVDAVARMLAQVDSHAQRPPIHLWNPELSGDIDINIDVDGHWFHENTRIEREKLVQLFASILRYESGIGFVLVTPVEKWRIRVDDAPFVVIAMSVRAGESGPAIWFASNVGEEVCLDLERPLVLEGEGENIRPYVEIRDGLRAKLARPVYYELAAMAQQRGDGFGVMSCGEFFLLS
ncbi:MAG: DUF1285 domain-containing protein [Pseudomonadales bacterium]